jgi:hypothetical protein
VKISQRLIFVTLILLTATSSSRAGSLSLVTSRAALGGNDSINWGQLDLPTLEPISNPFSISSTDGVQVTVSEKHPGSFYSDYDGNAWNGNFGRGDALLYSGPQYGAPGGPIRIDFGSNLVSGGGTQIEPNTFYRPFVARIVAYGSQMNVLGAFIEFGYAAPTNDDSALFVGVRGTPGRSLGCPPPLGASLGPRASP